VEGEGKKREKKKAHQVKNPQNKRSKVREDPRSKKTKTMLIRTPFRKPRGVGGKEPKGGRRGPGEYSGELNRGDDQNRATGSQDRPSKR